MLGLDTSIPSRLRHWSRYVQLFVPTSSENVSATTNYVRRTVRGISRDCPPDKSCRVSGSRRAAPRLLCVDRRRHGRHFARRCVHAIHLPLLHAHLCRELALARAGSRYILKTTAKRVAGGGRWSAATESVTRTDALVDLTVCIVHNADVCADLASHCRLLLHDRPKHKMFWRWLVLYPLYVLAEIAIISTDLAELLGSAIALCMLFPTLPLWAGVLLTASDVLLLLALRDPMRGRPVRLFELFIAVLVRRLSVYFAETRTDDMSRPGIYSVDLHGHYHLEGARALGRRVRRLPAVEDRLPV